MKKIITIGRQYASGGREIGKIVSEKLGIPFYDNKILTMAVEKKGLPVNYSEDVEETVPNSLLYSLAVSGTVNPLSENSMPLADRVYIAEYQIIKEIAQQEDCIIVGRCADYILRDVCSCINVFIYAGRQKRIERAVNEYKIPEKSVESHIKKMDKKRASFYNLNTDKKWGDRTGYDICLDSGRLGIKTCAEIIAAAYKSME